MVRCCPGLRDRSSLPSCAALWLAAGSTCTVPAAPGAGTTTAPVWSATRVQRCTRLLPLCAPRTATFGGQVGSRIGHLRQVVGRERRVAVQRHRVDQVPADVDTLYLPLPYRRVGADQPPASGAVAVPQPAKRQVQAIGREPNPR